MDDIDQGVPSAFLECLPRIGLSASDVPAILTAERYSRRALRFARSQLADLHSPPATATFAFGSLGRLEASSQSDLDLAFLYDSERIDKAGAETQRQAVIERLAAVFDIPQKTFDQAIDLRRLTRNIGGRFDTNETLTYRALLLTEGAWLGGGGRSMKHAVFRAYADAPISRGRFLASLGNDLHRYYRTLCMDYRHKVEELDKSWAIRVLKLRHSRKLWHLANLALQCWAVDAIDDDPSRDVALAARGAIPHAASLGLFDEGCVAETCSTPGTTAFRLLPLAENSGARRRDGLRHGLLADALPDGVLFLDGSLDPDSRADSLEHPACALLLETWASHGPRIDTKRKHLRDYLRLDFFAAVHRPMYENRPIHWPLSSARRTFVAWINIHRWHAGTLRSLLADHLHKTLRRLDGEIADLRRARDGADRKAANKAEKRLVKLSGWHEELTDFIAAIKQCAELGPDGRRDDATYEPNLDDGVMINAAALWPVLDPQWRDPKKWWAELVAAKGRKDYDWSQLAKRYFSQRVEAKCTQDPSLAVAHRCFWKYHPARAYAWELRLQDEIGPDFTLDEAGSDDARKAYLAAQRSEAQATREKETPAAAAIK